MMMGISPEFLVAMYHKQHALQEYMHEKRGLTLPPEISSNEISHDHVLAAIYFCSCLNIEWLELHVAYARYEEAVEGRALSGSIEEFRALALEELIDCLHFVLTVFIFLGLKPDLVSKLTYFGFGPLDSFSEIVGSSNLAISQLICTLPYKTWKDAEHTYVLTPEYSTYLFSRLSLVYNNLLDFATTNLHASCEEVVSVYLKKNELNFQRQEDKNLGYLDLHGEGENQ